MKSIRVKAKVYIPAPAVAFPLEKRAADVKGKYRDCLPSVDEYIREKREEHEREERRWEEEGI